MTQKKNNVLDKITGTLFIAMLIIMAMFVILIPVMIYPDKYGMITTVFAFFAVVYILIKTRNEKR